MGVGVGVGVGVGYMCGRMGTGERGENVRVRQR